MGEEGGVGLSHLDESCAACMCVCARTSVDNSGKDG